jgi:hypothetical protein
LVAATLGCVTACASYADLVHATATIPADQFIPAARVTEARFAGRAAFLRACPLGRAADLAVDATLFARAAVPMARALGGAASSIQATLGAGTARAAAARRGTSACAEDTDQVA